MTSPNYKELCTDCEEWTEDTCFICDLPLCDECADDHANNHDEECDNEF